MTERERGTTVQVRRFHRFSIFKPIKQADFSRLVLVLSLFMVRVILASTFDAFRQRSDPC